MFTKATLLQGYTHRDRFIVTQMPLPKTVADFWRMLYDYNSNTVIMLNEFDRNDKVCGNSLVSNTEPWIGFHEDLST